MYFFFVGFDLFLLVYLFIFKVFAHLHLLFKLFWGWEGSLFQKHQQVLEETDGDLMVARCGHEMDNFGNPGAGYPGE